MTEKTIAVVTGVGPGRGAAIVRRFSAAGFRIMALARSAELINRLAQELPDVHAMTCDVSDERQVRTVVNDVKGRFGPADVLIHNAVGGGWGNFREIDPKIEVIQPDLTKTQPFPEREFDVILVPALGFDRDNNRLGLGGGWYDRFVAQQPQAQKIGIAYAWALVEDGIPVEPWDMKLDRVTTG